MNTQDLIRDIAMVRDQLMPSVYPLQAFERICAALATAPPAASLREQEQRRIAQEVQGECSRIPGATFYNAAEFAIQKVLEAMGGEQKDAARWRFMEQADGGTTHHFHNLRPDMRAAYVDAQRLGREKGEAS